MNFVSITLLINLVTIIIGYILSYLIVKKQFMKDQSIQNRRYKDGHLHQRMMPLIVFNLSCLMIVAAIGSWLGQSWFVIETPTLAVFFGQVFTMMLIDDAFFYFLHRAMHESPYLYRKIHRIHHQATQPFPMEYMYVHPLEWSTGSIGVFLGIIVIHLVMPINAFAFWTYAAFRALHEITIHSGVKSKFAQYIPFWGTTEHHDFHHAKIDANYASTFTYWDKIFGTEATKAEREAKMNQ